MGDKGTVCVDLDTHTHTPLPADPIVFYTATGTSYAHPAASSGSKVTSLATKGLFLPFLLLEHMATFHLKEQADWSDESRL